MPARGFASYADALLAAAELLTLRAANEASLYDGDIEAATDRIVEGIKEVRRMILTSGPISNMPQDQAEQDTPDAA